MLRKDSQRNKWLNWSCFSPTWLPELYVLETLKVKASSSSSFLSSTPADLSHFYLHLRSLFWAPVMCILLLIELGWFQFPKPQMEPMIFPSKPGPSPIFEQGLKGISQACHLQRTSLLRCDGKVREILSVEGDVRQEKNLRGSDNTLYNLFLKLKHFFAIFLSSVKLNVVVLSPLTRVFSCSWVGSFC